MRFTQSWMQGKFSMILRGNYELIYISIPLIIIAILWGMYMDIIEISNDDLKKLHDILDKVYKSNPDVKEDALRFIRFLSKRDYLRRRDFDRNSFNIGLSKMIVDDQLCSIQIKELQSIAYGENSIVDLLHSLLFECEGIFPDHLLDDFFRRFGSFLDIIDSEKMVENRFLYYEILLINSYAVLKTFHTLVYVAKNKHFCKLNVTGIGEVDFINSFPVIDGVYRMDRFLGIKKSIDTLIELREFDYNQFDTNNLLLEYLKDINAYSTSNMLAIIENIGEFVNDLNGYYLGDKELNINEIVEELRDAFSYKTDKIIYYSEALLKGDRFNYINSKLEEIEENPYIRNEIFDAISKINASVFYDLDEVVDWCCDSFIGLMENVFDSDSYYELFSKLAVLKKLGEDVSLDDFSEENMISTIELLKTDSYKEKIGNYIVKMPVNTMNKVDKPKTIVGRIKKLYRNVYSKQQLENIDTIHMESGSYNNFMQQLATEIKKLKENVDLDNGEEQGKNVTKKKKPSFGGWI